MMRALADVLELLFSIVWVLLLLAAVLVVGLVVQPMWLAFRGVPVLDSFDESTFGYAQVLQRGGA